MEIKKGKGMQWIDVEKPMSKDLAWIEKNFDLHPVIIDELIGPSARAHVEAYDDYLFFVYYFPLYDTGDLTSIRSEIDFVITKDAVITVHYEPLHRALEGFEVKTIGSSLEFVYEMVRHLTIFQERELRHIREKVEDVGREIFKDKEREVLEQVTHLKRDISEYRIVVRLQEPIFRSLLLKGKKFWGDDAEIYLNDLMGDHLKLVNQIEDYREAVSDFEDTNNQLMNLKINTVMKTFTSLSFLTFPFMLLAGLFSMNTHDTPIVNLAYGFWIILAVMGIMMIALAVYFKRKGWF